MGGHTARRYSYTTSTTTIIEPEIITIKPPKKDRSKGQWARVSNTSSRQCETKGTARKTQHRTEKITTPYHSTKKSSNAEHMSSKNGTPGKSGSRTKGSWPEDQPATRDATHDTQSTASHPGPNSPQKGRSKLTCEAICLPYKGSPFRTTIPLIQFDPDSSGSDRCRSVEEWLGYSLDKKRLGDNVERWLGYTLYKEVIEYEPNFSWNDRALEKIVSKDLDEDPHAIYFIYLCLNQGSGLRRNGYLERMSKMRAYGDIFFFKIRDSNVDEPVEGLPIESEELEDVVKGGFTRFIVRELLKRVVMKYKVEEN